MICPMDTDYWNLAFIISLFSEIYNIYFQIFTFIF